MTKQSSSDTSQISHANSSTYTFQDRPSLYFLLSLRGGGFPPWQSSFDHHQIIIANMTINIC